MVNLCILTTTVSLDNDVEKEDTDGDNDDDHIISTDREARFNNVTGAQIV